MEMDANDTENTFVAQLLNQPPSLVATLMTTYITKRFEPERRGEAVEYFKSVLKIAASETVDTPPKSLLLSDVQPERTDWLWSGYIPLGMLTIICGDGGVGKGTLTLDLAARITRGEPFPLLSLPSEPAKVLLLVTAEEDLRRTVVPRLIAAGADLSQCVVPDDEDEPYKFPQRIQQLEDLIKQHAPRYVLIDPLTSYLSGDLNIYRDQDVRKMTQPLKSLAESTRCAIVIVHHQNRNSGAQASARVSGSSGIRNSARVLYFVGKPPDTEPSSNLRVFACDKMNPAVFPPSLSFSIEKKEIQFGGEFHSLPYIVWHGTTECTANELVSPPLLAPKKEDDSPLKQAISFYLEALADGERLSAEVEEEREEAGISERTAKRARGKLAVRRRKEGFNPSVWYVSLPEECQETPKSAEEGIYPEEAFFGKTWHSSTKSGEEQTIRLPYAESDTDEPLPPLTFAPELCIICYQRSAEGTDENPRWCRQCFIKQKEITASTPVKRSRPTNTPKGTA